MECSKRGWEQQQLQKLKEEEEDRQLTEGEEDLFTYTREDAYNMVSSCRDLQSNMKWRAWLADLLSAAFPQEYVFDAEDGHTEIMPVRLRIKLCIVSLKVSFRPL